LNAHNLRDGGGRVRTPKMLKALLEIAPKHNFLIFIPKGAGYPDFSTYPNVEAVYEAPSGLKRIYWFRKILYPKIRQFSPDWVWTMGALPLSGLDCRQSILFSDAHLLNYPFSHFGETGGSWLTVWYRTKLKKYIIRKNVNEVDRIYVQTQTARKRFEQTYNYPAEKIGLCRNTCSILPSKSLEMPEAMKPYRDKFRMLAATRYNKYKNLDQIARMYHQFKDELKDTVFFLTTEADNKSQRLKDTVFFLKTEAGSKVWRLRRLCDWVRKWKLEEHFVFVGRQELDNLANWYAHCHALLLPTLLESFSAMYVEAMAYGSAILTSDLDFAHEICGDAALYFDPFSTESIKNRIIELKTNEKLYQQVVERGRARYQTHVRSWPEILRDVLDQESIEHE